ARSRACPRARARHRRRARRRRPQSGRARRRGRRPRRDQRAARRCGRARRPRREDRRGADRKVGVMARKYLRGALIDFTETFPLPIPNVIIFQYNPETMTHPWTPATTSPGTPGSHTNQLAISGQPMEAFSFTLVMDANDMIADGDAVETGLATVSGV